MLQALSSAERVARAPSKLYPLLRGRGNWRIAQLLQDALPNIALDYANKQVGGGAPLFIYLPATYVAVPPTTAPPTLCAHSPSVHLSVCLSVCLPVGLFGLVFAWLSVKTDGLKAQGCCRCRSWRCTCASSSRTLLLLLMLPLLFVLVKQRRHEGGKGGGWRHTQKEKHEGSKK